MYGVVLMAAMAVGGPGCDGWAGGLAWYGTPPGLGYGRLVPPVHNCCGIVLPPMPAEDMTTKAEFHTWEEYVNALEGDEKTEMIGLWVRGDVHARRKLLMKLSALKEKLQEDKDREENDRPLTDAELKKWDAHLDKLKGEKKMEAEERWKKADNKGKRQMLEEIDKEGDARRPARTPALVRRGTRFPG